jgi:hypothetical protein
MKAVSPHLNVPFAWVVITSAFILAGGRNKRATDEIQTNVENFTRLRPAPAAAPRAVVSRLNDYRAAGEYLRQAAHSTLTK